ncbi:MAG: hypothetical protein ACRD09_15400 [Vicinamibacterales bacterium]
MRRVVFGSLMAATVAFGASCSVAVEPAQIKKVRLVIDDAGNSCDKDATTSPNPNPETVQGSKRLKQRILWEIENKCSKKISVCATSPVALPPLPIDQEDPLDDDDDKARRDKKERCTDVEAGVTDTIRTKVKRNAGEGRYQYRFILRVGDQQKEIDPMIEIVP